MMHTNSEIVQLFENVIALEVQESLVPLDLVEPREGTRFTNDRFRLTRGV